MEPNKHHFDPAGFNHDPNDRRNGIAPALAPSQIDDIEPLAEPVNGFRSAGQSYLRTLLVVDEFLTTSNDARLAWIAVAVVVNPVSRAQRRLYRRTDRLHAGGVDPVDCQSQDDGRY